MMSMATCTKIDDTKINLRLVIIFCTETKIEDCTWDFCTFPHIYSCFCNIKE